MNSIWETVTWNIARAGGFTAYILLAFAVITGLALSTQLQSPGRWPRLINNELHNFLTLLSSIFLVVHILAVWIDPFTHFGWNEILLPFVSHYRPIWMALGIVALYLGLAIAISTWLRPRIGYKLWRKLHVLTLLLFVLATIHGIGTGSDTSTGWARGIYLVSSIAVGLLLCRKLFGLKARQKPAPRVVARPQAQASTAVAGADSLTAQPRANQQGGLKGAAITGNIEALNLEQILALIDQMEEVDPNDNRYKNRKEATMKL